jgi:hypothetical protein
LPELFVALFNATARELKVDACAFEPGEQDAPWFVRFRVGVGFVLGAGERR